MGAYLSKPDKKLHLIEGSTDAYDFAAGSMRGWRVTNEDAHTCLTNFDENASLFAVFDGHGGAEVAEVAANELAEHIKNNELYKKGDYEAALRNSFINFDKYLRANEALLEQVKERINSQLDQDQGQDQEDEGTTKDENPEAGGSGAANGESAVVEDVDFETLTREALCPIEELMKQYCDKKTRKLFDHYFNSPLINKKQKNENDDEMPSTSSSNDGPEKSNTSDDPAPQTSSSKGNDDQDKPREKKVNKPLSALLNPIVDEEDAESDSSYYYESNEDGDDEDEDDEKLKDVKEISIRLGEVDKRHLKNKDSDSYDSSNEENENFDDDEDDDEDDEDDGDDGDDEDDEDDEEDEDDEDDEEDEEADDTKDLVLRNTQAMSHYKPGHDSGCTAVVSLIKDNILYVASAGDSRCLLLKKDEYIPMSYDHKPTDTPESNRIQKAGGQVVEGRVNGGLNLSRALGDFAYKDENEKPEDQMISPVPDVKKIDLSNSSFEYVVVACDGIWNSLENDELGDFIYDVAPDCKGDLTELIKRIFQACLAPNTRGDGSGCDNMTCIILRFKSHNKNQEECPTEVSRNDLQQEQGNQTSNKDDCNSKRKNDFESNNNIPLKKKCIEL